MVCYCYGPSCFDSDKTTEGVDDEVMSKLRTVVRGEQRESYSTGVNKSCYFKKFGTNYLECQCDPNWSGGPARELYQQGSN